jgi:hypothetical protein
MREATHQRAGVDGPDAPFRHVGATHPALGITGQGTRAGAQERLHLLTAELTPQLAAEARAQRRRSP